jgi:serine/threonine protein kinase
MPPSSLHPLEAVVRHQGRTLACCVLRRGTYVIGQERRNEIVAQAPSVAPRHAQLTVEGDNDFLLEDLSGGGGTLVNGEAITGSTAVTLDCKVQIGEATLEFQRGGLPATVFQYFTSDFLGAQRYVVGDAIVEGNTSTIHEAREVALGRGVAMRILRPESQSDPDHVLRFLREAQIMGQLQHPGILPVYDLGLDEQRRLFSTTRFVEGDTLSSLIDAVSAQDSPETPRPTLALLLGILQKVIDTVAYAHAQGVVHSTLRPDMITVGQFGEVFVSQWSFAKLIDLADGQPCRVQAPPAGREPRLSRYSAPEQAEDATDDIGPRTDVHALGGLLFRVLTLKDPMSGETESEILEQALSPRPEPHEVVAGHPPCPHWPGGKMPEGLAAITAKALSLAPEDRYATVREVQQAIAAWQEGTTTAPGEASKLWKGFTGLLSRHS